jgi:hypothetical protein
MFAPGFIDEYQRGRGPIAYCRLGDGNRQRHEAVGRVQEAADIQPTSSSERNLDSAGSGEPLRDDGRLSALCHAVAATHHTPNHKAAAETRV